MSFLRTAMTASLLLGLAACATQPPEPVSYQRRAVSFSATAARDWLSQYRQSKGLPPVVLDSRLVAFAQTQANVMAAHNELKHDVGGDFVSRARAANLYGAGENISYGTYTDADAMRQWKNSPGHNANLLLPRATRFGIAIATSGGRVYWAMVIAGDPPAAGEASIFGQGPTVRVVRRPAPSGLGGLFGN
ncbi:hypothetical protein LMIY3S_05310 [Labrys miyagiensis]